MSVNAENTPISSVAVSLARSLGNPIPQLAFKFALRSLPNFSIARSLKSRITKSVGGADLGEEIILYFPPSLHGSEGIP